MMEQNNGKRFDIGRLLVCVLLDNKYSLINEIIDKGINRM